MSIGGINDWFFDIKCDITYPSQHRTMILINPSLVQQNNNWTVPRVQQLSTIVHSHCNQIMNEQSFSIEFEQKTKEKNIKLFIIMSGLIIAGFYYMIIEQSYITCFFLLLIGIFIYCINLHFQESLVQEWRAKVIRCISQSISYLQNNGTPNKYEFSILYPVNEPSIKPNVFDNRMPIQICFQGIYDEIQWLVTKRKQYFSLRVTKHEKFYCKRSEYGLILLSTMNIPVDYDYTCLQRN
eukprot:302549_1